MATNLDDIITLQAGEIALTQTESEQGISLSASTEIFGLVALVSELSDKFSLGQIVIFNPNNCLQFTYGSGSYYLIKESEIRAIEKPVI